MRWTRARSLVLGVVALAASPAGAQQVPFLSDLIARIEQSSRLYNDKRRAGADLSIVEPVRKRSEEAFRRGNIPGLLESLGEGIALLTRRPWDDRAKFLSSLSVEPDRLVVEPNKNVQVSLSQMFPTTGDKSFPAPPAVTFEIIPMDAAPGRSAGDSAALRLRKPVLISEHVPIGELTTNASRRVLLPDGAYWVAATIEAGTQKLAVLRKPIYVIADFTDQLAEFSKAIAAIKNSTDPKVKTVSPLVATPEFWVQRLATLVSSRGDDMVNPIEELDRVEAALTTLEKGTNPFTAERGEVERAYLASDGDLVPYRLYIPKSYDGKSARPLVVMLHGALGDERSYFSDLYDADVIKGEAERRGVILAAPNGRGRFSGYRGPGQEDVFEVIKAATRDLAIDPARIYLTGHSMGAGATWVIASTKPELFAAMAPVSGGGPSQPQAAAALLEKVKAIPTLVVHGARDGIAPPERSRDMVAAAQKAGLTVSHLEIADADHVSVVARTFAAVMDFFEKHSKKQK
ncbi:MAG TPA: PHB depolymerase family esterase [Blastocatellia bacterium]|nr:PHB depolymerase family esterase [Blastocatellia bacterium]